eukprot:Phypoly_transcript_00309.p1 GENE.Phypoly_transcript_00309~~Phypoly_transcript_00309.p1  ORF type:complete len:1204 (+),score=218.86 Phypoly_transcript_00309:62-3673(+)
MMMATNEEEGVHNFGVFRKKHKKGLAPYIFQFNFQHNFICFARKGTGKPKNRFAFYKIVKVSISDTHPHLFTLELFHSDKNRVKSYLCFAQTAGSREKIVSVLQSIIVGVQKRISMFPLPHHIRALATSPAFIHYVGKVEKRGKVKWAERWLILNDQKLVVYRSREDEFPLNIIELSYASVELMNEQVFRVSCLDRHYDFKATSSYERDAWFRKLFKETAENTQKLPTLPTKSMFKIPKKKSGKSYLRSKSRRNSDSGSDTNSDASSASTTSDYVDHLSETPMESSSSSQGSSGSSRSAGCRFCYGLSSVEGTSCFYCAPSSSQSSDSSNSTMSEDYMPNTKPKTPCILNSFATIHELANQPGATNLRTYLANSKYAAVTSAFLPATPTTTTSSKSQLWRPRDGVSKVDTVPEGTIHRSLSANSLLELNGSKAVLSSAPSTDWQFSKSTSNEAITASPSLGTRSVSPVLNPIPRSNAIAVIKRERRIDSPLTPIKENPTFSLDPSTPPRMHLSPRLETASPPRHTHIPPKDEISFPHYPKPLPVPPSPLLTTAPQPNPHTNTDWFKSPIKYSSASAPSSPTSSSAPTSPAVFLRQPNDGVNPNTKLRPDPIRLDVPSLPKARKTLPLPPDQISELPRNIEQSPRNSPRTTEQSARNSPRKTEPSPRISEPSPRITEPSPRITEPSPRNQEQLWKPPANIHVPAKSHPIVPTTVSHALPLPPPPPPPSRTESPHSRIVNSKKLNVLPAGQSPIPPPKPSWRQSVPFSPKASPSLSRERATKSMPNIHMSVIKGRENGPTSRPRSGTGEDRNGDRKGDRNGDRNGDGNSGSAGKPTNGNTSGRTSAGTTSTPRSRQSYRQSTNRQPQQSDDSEPGPPSDSESTPSTKFEASSASDFRTLSVNTDKLLDDFLDAPLDALFSPSLPFRFLPLLPACATEDASYQESRKRYSEELVPSLFGEAGKLKISGPPLSLPAFVDAREICEEIKIEEEAKNETIKKEYTEAQEEEEKYQLVSGENNEKQNPTEVQIDKDEKNRTVCEKSERANNEESVGQIDKKSDEKDEKVSERVREKNDLESKGQAEERGKEDEKMGNVSEKEKDGKVSEEKIEDEQIEGENVEKIEEKIAEGEKNECEEISGQKSEEGKVQEKSEEGKTEGEQIECEKIEQGNVEAKKTEAENIEEQKSEEPKTEAEKNRGGKTRGGGKN